MALGSFELLIGTASAEITVTSVNDKDTFDTARSSAVWNGRLRMGSSGD